MVEGFAVGGGMKASAWHEIFECVGREIRTEHALGSMEIHMVFICPHGQMVYCTGVYSLSSTLGDLLCPPQPTPRLITVSEVPCQCNATPPLIFIRTMTAYLQNWKTVKMITLPEVLLSTSCSAQLAVNGAHMLGITEVARIVRESRKFRWVRL